MILTLTTHMSHSSDQEAIMDILCPDLNSEYDSYKEDSLFSTRITIQPKYLRPYSAKHASDERKASHIHH